MALMDQNDRLRSTNFSDLNRQKDINEIMFKQMLNKDDYENIKDPYVSHLKNQYQE